MQEITLLLERIAGGDNAALDDLMPLIYGDLKRRARALARRESDLLTIGTTGLLHECYLRLLGGNALEFKNRRHFYAAAGEAMRRILIERARALSRAKRGGGAEHVELHPEQLADAPGPEDVLVLDELLARLERHDPTMATVVKLRYFGGMSVAETAQALSISARSVNRAWTAARAWLQLRWDEARQGDRAP